MNWLLCIDNNEYKASLEPRKLYQSLPDEQANKIGMVRIIDESGEDYLYSKSLFVEMPAIVNPVLDMVLLVA